MKKIFIIILMMGIAFPLMSDTRYDAATGSFCTIPASPNIDQNEYQNLFIQVGVKVIFGMNEGKLGYEMDQEITRYLTIIGTPTALRLISDLQKQRYDSK